MNKAKYLIFLLLFYLPYIYNSFLFHTQKNNNVSYVLLKIVYSLLKGNVLRIQCLSYVCNGRSLKCDRKNPDFSFHKRYLSPLINNLSVHCFFDNQIETLSRRLLKII